jgi:hypothetical protein
MRRTGKYEQKIGSDKLSFHYFPLKIERALKRNGRCLSVQIS